MQIKNIREVFQKIRNLCPYLIIIIIYFLIINVEAIKNKNNERRINNIDSDLKKRDKNNSYSNISIQDDSKLIAIPIIPFKVE